MKKEIFEKYKTIGVKAAIECEAKFEKEYLYTKNNFNEYEPVHYGLYICFTVMTQHTYGTPDELLFILGVMFAHNADIEPYTHEFYKEGTDNYIKAMTMAVQDELIEMKRIGEINGIIIDSENPSEAYDKYFNRDKFIASNYFYYYRIGRYMFHECELKVANEEI